MIWKVRKGEKMEDKKIKLEEEMVVYYGSDMLSGYM